jgi:copper chaperone CopZ
MKRSICLGTILMLVSLTARADTIEMKVFGMVCGFCAQGIEANLRKNPAVTDVVVSLEKKLVIVETRAEGSIDDAVLAKTIADAGYSLKSVSRTQRTMADYRAAIERSEE